MFCMVPKFNRKTKKEALNYAKQLHHFCLQIDKTFTISHKEFKDLDWLPVYSRFEQCVISITFKSINGSCPYYLNKFLNLHPNVILV